MAGMSDTVAHLAVEAVADSWRADQGPAAASRLLQRLKRLRLLDPDCGDGGVLTAVIDRLHALAVQACAMSRHEARLRLQVTALARDPSDAWAMWRRLEASGGAAQVRTADPLLVRRGVARWPRADLIVSGRDGPVGSLAAERGQSYADAVWRQDEGRFRSARTDLLLLDRALRAVARRGGLAVLTFDPAGQEDAWEEIRLQLSAGRRAPILQSVELDDGRLCIVARGVAWARASSMAGPEPIGAGPWSKPMSSFWAEATTGWSAPSIWRAPG